jgi:hypothetical protein
MKPDKRLSGVKPSEPRGFYDLAKAHVEAHGGAWFVVDKRQTPQQWRAWIAYFAWLDGQTIPCGRKATAFGALEKLTVPTEWPLWFDAGAPPSPLPDQREEMPSPDRRKRLAQMLHGVVADIQLREGRAPTWRNMTASQAEDRLGKLSADYSRTAPAVSTPDMAKYLTGMREEPIEFEETA